MISIIVPVYNSEKTLARCIDSILHQTYYDYELILIDDGSTDASFSIIEKYAISHPNIVAIHKENGGVSSARNKGLGLAKGNFVCFVDSDDYVEPNYLEDLHNCISNNDTDIALCLISCSREKVSSTNTVYNNKDAIITSILNNEEHNAGPYNKLFRKDIIGNLRFAEDIFLGEDTLFCVEYAKKCSTAIRINKVLYHYEMPTCSIQYRTDKSKIFKNLTVLESRKRMLCNTSMLNEQSKNIIIKSLLSYSTFIAILGTVHNDLNLINAVSKELGILKESYHLEYTNWHKLLYYSPLLYYIIKKTLLKADAFQYHIKNIKP